MNCSIKFIADDNNNSPKERGRKSPFVFLPDVKNFYLLFFIRKFPGACFFILCLNVAFAQKRFDFNINCQRAYHAMMSMHFREGDSLLALEKSSHPDNLIPYFVEDFKDFFIISFNEDPKDVKQREPNKELRLHKLQQGPKNSPYYLYTQGEILVHWSVIHLASEQYRTAFFELRRAYRLLEENQQRFPEFVANKKFMGLIHAIVGTIPDNYKWAVSFLGLKGTVPQGLAEVKEVMDYAQVHSFLFEDETRYIYLFMKLWLANDMKAAWQLTEDAQYPALKSNPLSTYVKAFVATKMNNNDLAIQLFSSNDHRSNVLVPWFTYYMLGITKLRRLDDNANVPLETFLKNFRGVNYVKDAYRNLAWSYLLRGDVAKYHNTIAFCRTKGKLFADSDKEALEELNYGIPPNIILLRARLLTDGAYFDRAMQLLQGKTANDFSSEKDKLEFTYRLGRIYEETGELDKAIQYYIATIDRGSNTNYYFADNASLRLAGIYEKQKNYDRARYYYTKCLQMKENVFKTSIDQKAKAGLSRLNNQRTK